MGLISIADQQRLRDAFAAMARGVRLLFFTQTFDCDTCLETRQILDELPPLCDRISVEEVNFVLDQERAAAYGIDRVPAIALVDEEGRDTRVRFLGVPAGYEFISLVEAILLVGGRVSHLSPESLARIAAVNRPTTMHVFTTPTCPHCPRAVNAAHEMAYLNPHITAYAVEVTEFPDLVARYAVNGVPKTVVIGPSDDASAIEILGSMPADDFVEQALGITPTSGDVPA